MVKEYYVYAWFFKSTGKVFHIGKGKGNRYLETRISRNTYFKNIVAKYPNDVDVKKIAENLTDDDACSLERKLIAEYKAKGECETNFHEGGHGGNTGNYHSKERHDKLSHAAKLRVSKLNSNYGNYWTAEQKQAQSDKMKALWSDPEVKKKFLQNRHYEDFVPWNKGKKCPPSWNAGNKMSNAHYLHMMQADCPYKYEVYYDNTLIYWCLGRNLLDKFCKETFNISKTIVNQILTEDWKPKFKKHMVLESLTIKRLDRSVTTNRDECSGVEWRLLPFEVPGNQVIG